MHHVTTEKSQIGVDAIRQTISKVSQTAQLSGNKVVIISQVELMSESASNALLKTLEEPTANTYLLMTSNESQRLLPTILSRCEKRNIALPSFEQSCDWLSAQGVSVPTKAASSSAFAIKSVAVFLMLFFFGTISLLVAANSI